MVGTCWEHDGQYSGWSGLSAARSLAPRASADEIEACVPEPLRQEEDAQQSVAPPHRMYLVALTSLFAIGVALCTLTNNGSTAPSSAGVNTDQSNKLIGSLVDEFDNTMGLRPVHLRALKKDKNWWCVERQPLLHGLRVKFCDPISPLQQWHYIKETGHVVSEQGGLCLSHAGEVHLSECNNASASLRWVYADKHLSNSDGDCLDWFGGEVHMKKCSDASGERVSFYRFKPLAYKYTKLNWPSGPRHIKHGAHGYCLEYRGYQVVRAPCKRAAANQQWVYFSTTHQIATFWHHKCLGAHFAPGHADSLSLEPCRARSKAQKWYQHESTHHLASGLGVCLHSKGPILGRCADSSGLTHWSMPRVSGWAPHAGVVFPKFDTPSQVPPQHHSGSLAKCRAGEPGYGHCGADKLQKVGLPKKKLQDLQRFIWRWSWPDKVVVHAGDQRGLWFRYGKQYANRQYKLASEFKLMTALVAMRLVELGIISLEDQVNKWLAWWPRATADSRSYITVRHCLSFTTGFYASWKIPMDGSLTSEIYPFREASPKWGLHGWYELKCKTETTIGCAQKVLSKTNHIAPPGTVWTYTEDHLRILAAVMVEATGKSYDTLMEQYLFSRTVPPMLSTNKYKHVRHWNPGSAAFSTARDYQRLMDSYFRGHLVSNDTAHEMESDSQVQTKVRYFMGDPTEGRPAHHGLFGLGVWRSHSTKTACGVWAFCAFAPSYYLNTAVVERMWPYYNGEKKCPWKHSSSCSYYHHWSHYQNIWTPTLRMKYGKFSHALDLKIHKLLSGGSEVPHSHA